MKIMAVLIVLLGVSTAVLGFIASRSKAEPARIEAPPGVVVVPVPAPEGEADALLVALSEAALKDLRTRNAALEKRVAVLERELAQEEAAREKAEEKAEMTPKAYDLFKENERLGKVILQLQARINFLEKTGGRGYR